MFPERVPAPHDPLRQNLDNTLARPGRLHVLGTDNVGRDVLSRVIYGTRVSLAAGFGSQVAMSLMRRTPLPDGQRRAPSELGYAYRIVDADDRQLALRAGCDFRVGDVDDIACGEGVGVSDRGHGEPRRDRQK
jgi:hypothetical protein